jgi:hypothetical protein
MATNNNLRYQIYSIKINGDLDKPVTIPILTIERANKYFSDCCQCALVSIDEYGSIVEIIDKDLTPIKETNKKPKIIKRFNSKR